MEEKKRDHDGELNAHNNHMAHTNRIHVVHMAVSGIAIVALILLCGVVFMALEGQEVLAMRTGANMRPVLSAYSQFINAYTTEFGERTAGPTSLRKDGGAGDEQATAEMPGVGGKTLHVRALQDSRTRSDTDSTFALFKSRAEMSSEEAAALQDAIDKLRDPAVTTGKLFLSFLTVLNVSSVCAMQRLQRYATRWFVDTVRIVAMESNTAAVHSTLLNLLYYEEYKKDTDFLSEDEAALLTSQVSSLDSSLALTAGFEVGGTLWSTFLNNITLLQDDLVLFKPHPDATVYYNDTDPALSDLADYLDDLTTIQTVSPSDELGMLAYACVSCAFCLLALVLNFVVLRRYWQTTSKTRKMLSSFEDEKKFLQVREHYLPLLQELRAVTLHQHSSHHTRHLSEVEREYLVTARFINTLRVTVPQLLLGKPQRAPAKLTRAAKLAGSEHGSQIDSRGRGGQGPQRGAGRTRNGGSNAEPGDAAGGWDILAQKVRLQLGTWNCSSVVVMEVGLVAGDEWDARLHTNHLLEHTDAEQLTGHLALLCRAYRIIVEIVNGSGGVVMGFVDGGRVMAAWNVTNLVERPALTALRVGCELHYRLLAGVPGLLRVDVAVVTGCCVLSNAVLGNRQYPLLTGTMLAQLHKLRLIAATLTTSLLMDSYTYAALPLQVRDYCKPVVLVKMNSGNESITMVVYCVEEMARTTQQQVELYRAGFFLYQSNITAEAVEQFKRYTCLYPEDRVASWLLHQVLLPRQLLYSKLKEAED